MSSETSPSLRTLLRFRLPVSLLSLFVLIVSVATWGYSKRPFEYALLAGLAALHLYLLFAANRKAATGIGKGGLALVLAAAAAAAGLLMSGVRVQYHVAIAAVFLIAMLPLLLLVARRNSQSEAALPYLVACSVSIALFLPELLLPLKGYPVFERFDWGTRLVFRDGGFRPSWEMGKGGRLRPDLHYLFVVSPERPLIEFTTDKHGFRVARAHCARCSGSELRVLAMGDSVMTGFALDDRDTILANLAAALSVRLARTIAVYGAETSDPAYTAHYFRAFGSGFRWDLVIYLLYGGNDFYQSYLHAGHPSASFVVNSDGSVAWNKGYSWKETERVDLKLKELVYDHQATRTGERVGSRTTWISIGGIHQLLALHLIRHHLSDRPAVEGKYDGTLPQSYAEELEVRDGRKRLFEGGTSVGIFLRSPPPEIRRSFGIAERLLERLSQDVKAQGTPFLLAYFPVRYQVVPNDWEKFRERWALRAGDFDLSLPEHNLAALSERIGMNFVSLTDDLRMVENAHKLFLENDNHPSPAGSRRVAEILSGPASVLLGDEHDGTGN